MIPSTTITERLSQAYLIGTALDLMRDCGYSWTRVRDIISKSRAFRREVIHLTDLDPEDLVSLCVWLKSLPRKEK